MKEITTAKKIKKIDCILNRKGHIKMASILFENYNQYNVYVRFDLVKKLGVFKVTNIDLDYTDIKHLEDYISVQIVDRMIGLNILSCLKKIKYPNDIRNDEDIEGDRVHFTINDPNNDKIFIFTRFLPEDLKLLAEPLVLILSYLPRSIDQFLNEVFAILDGTDEFYTYSKPVKFNLETGDLRKIFKKPTIEHGNMLYKTGKVKFLEKINNKNIALVLDNKEPNRVLLEQIDETHATFNCNCNAQGLCPHIYAVLKCIRANKYNSFCKLKYIGENTSPFAKITADNIYLFCGIAEDQIVLTDIKGKNVLGNLMENGKIAYEVIEDNDCLNLVTLLKREEKKQKEQNKRSK